MTAQDATRFYAQVVHSFGHPLVQVAQDTTVGVSAVAAAVVTAGLRMHIALAVIVCAFMVLDLLTGIGKAFRLKQKLDKPKLYGGIVGKFLLIALVFVAVGIDVGVAYLFPGGGPAGITNAGLLTTTVLALLMIGEGASVVKNVRDAKVGGGLFASAAMIRHLDRLKTGLEDPPTNRHYDPPALEAERRLHPHGTDEDTPK